MEENIYDKWKELVKLYCPPDKRVCNCGRAYYTWFPPETSRTISNGVPVGAWHCNNGCSANQIEACDIVAAEILK